MHYQKRLEGYDSRYNKWEQERRTQLSFFNNLILTIGVGFLAYMFQLEKLNSLSFSICNLNWKITLLVVSTLCVALSIFCGIIVALSRLYDFRITAKIVLSKKRLYKSQARTFHRAELNTYSFCNKVWFFIRYCIRDKKLTEFTKEQLSNYKMHKNEFDDSFNELRDYSHNLGLITWAMLRWQLFSFIVAIILFVIGHFC